MLLRRPASRNWEKVVSPPKVRGQGMRQERGRGLCAAGFSLINLLVVIAIVAILAAIAFPMFAIMRAKAAGERARKSVSLCEASLSATVEAAETVDCLTKAQSTIDEWKGYDSPDAGLTALIKQVNDRIDEGIASDSYSDVEKRDLQDHKLH